MHISFSRLYFHFNDVLELLINLYYVISFHITKLDFFIKIKCLIAASLCLLPTKKVSTSYEVDTLTVCILTGYHACLSRQATGVHPSFSLNTLYR